MSARATASRNQELKDGFIKRSVDMLARELSDEERKKLMSLDQKTREKYLYRAMAEGFTGKKQKGAHENAFKEEDI